MTRSFIRRCSALVITKLEKQNAATEMSKMLFAVRPVRAKAAAVKKKHTSKSPSGSRCSVLSQPPGGRGCCGEPREHGSFLLQRSRRTPTTPNGPTSPRSIKLPPCLLALFLHFYFCSVKLWHCQACYHLWLKIFTVGSANSCHDEQTLHTALMLANTLHLFYYYYF